MTDKNDNGLNRRDFLGLGSALTLGLLVGGAAGLHAEEIQTPAPPAPADAPPASPVVGAVIGLGEQGRALLTSLNYVPGATIKYVCDSYEGAHKRALDIAPKATAVTDYRKVLQDPAVKAVWVATPSHLHKEIVLAALQAGKNVYCEAPLASSIEDAKAIARAALAAPKQIFHTGLQQRTNPQHNHVVQFIRTGALGKTAHMRSQWHKKTSWRRAAPTPEREQALNWRLKEATSGGLMGEIGIHQLDVANWFAKAAPIAITGYGGILNWRDGRDVYDTVQCLVEYPENVYLSYNATLANSFDGAYELFQGTDAAVLVKDGRAWMFKETDAPSLGWEVYAAKEQYGDETGIALVADATKLLALGKEPAKNRDTDPTRGSLYYASDAFLNGIREGKQTASGAEVGYQAVVTALKAHQAIKAGTKVAFQKTDFDLD